MNKIDFIIAWVDGNDPLWQKAKSEYVPDKSCDVSAIRYRDMGILRYWFRAVEKYAPWVNKIHFITWGHLPSWLDTSNTKLNIVRHEDYIPDKYLPTFSSRPIELNMHRINGLSERFVYFNDDMLLNAPVKPEFFFKNGLPCDYMSAKNIYYHSVSDTHAHTTTNCVVELNKHFSYKKSFFSHLFKYVNFKYGFKQNVKNILKLENGSQFTGIENPHLPVAYLKKTLIDCWEKCQNVLEMSSSEKFRTPYDVNQYIFRYFQLASGNFSPVKKSSRGCAMNLMQNIESVCDVIKNARVKTVCINDNEIGSEFEFAKNKIISAYEEKLSQKSSFEI